MQGRSPTIYTYKVEPKISDVKSAVYPNQEVSAKYVLAQPQKASDGYIRQVVGCTVSYIIQLLTSDSVPRKVFVTQTSNHSATKLQDRGHRRRDPNDRNRRVDGKRCDEGTNGGKNKSARNQG